MVPLMRTVALFLSATGFCARLCGAEVPCASAACQADAGEEVALLQTQELVHGRDARASAAAATAASAAAAVGHQAASAAATKQFPGISAFVPNDGYVCFQGPTSAMSEPVAYFRGTPLMNFNSRAGRQDDVICATLGYPQLVFAQDVCLGWSHASMYVRADADVTQVLTQVRARSTELVQEWVDQRGIQMDSAMRWTSCLLCEGGAERGFRWWGAYRHYAASDCEGLFERAIQEMQSVTPRIASFTPIAGSVCFEGDFNYLQSALRNASSTPWRAMYADVTVVEQSCAERGYDAIRDPIDECWPQASKHMRDATEDADMQRWVFGPDGYHITLDAYDQQHNLRQNFAAEWASCGACARDSAVFHRGMVVTMQGALARPFDEEQCVGVMREVADLGLTA